MAQERKQLAPHPDEKSSSGEEFNVLKTRQALWILDKFDNGTNDEKRIILQNVNKYLDFNEDGADGALASKLELIYEQKFIGITDLKIILERRLAPVDPAVDLNKIKNNMDARDDLIYAIKNYFTREQMPEAFTFVIKQIYAYHYDMKDLWDKVEEKFVDYDKMEDVE